MCLLYDDDSRVLIADMPSMGPEMPCVMEQYKVIAVVGKSHPSAVGGMKQLVRIGGAQTPFGRGRENEMAICPQGSSRMADTLSSK